MRSQQPILDYVARNEGCLRAQLQARPLHTASTMCMANPGVSQAEWGHKDFQERERRAQSHQNRKHCDKEKPLLGVQSRGSIKEGRMWHVK